MSANPIDLVGGLTSTSNVIKSDLTAWAKARVPQLLADVTELRNTTLANQLSVLLKSTGQFFYLDAADTTTADDGITCIISSDGKRFKALGDATTIAIAAVQAAAGTATPLVDGTAAVGTGTKWAREDHVHPTDTSRAPINNPTFTGTAQAPTPAGGDSSTKIATTAWVAANAPGAASVSVFETRAAVAAVTVSGNVITVQRYSTSTPVCPGRYLRLGSTPSPVKAWHIQDLSGAYFQLVETQVYPEHLGAVGDNSIDDVTAVGNWVSYILTVGAEGRLAARFYKTSGNIVLPDGTDPGGFKITGVGMDYSGFNYTGTGDFISGPATGSNRHVGVMLRDFETIGNNTGNIGINVQNALNCVYYGVHIRGFTNDAIRFDGSVSYGALQCVVENCKTSPTTSNASLQAGNPAAVNIVLANYVKLFGNYFSGAIDGTHWLDRLVKNAGDTTSLRDNIFESANHCVTTSGSSFLSDHDAPVGSSIQSSEWYTITANAPTRIDSPRGATRANVNTSAVTEPGNLTLDFENSGRDRNYKTFASFPGSTMNVAGLDYINCNFTGTITAFSNVVIGKLYTFYFHGGTTFARTNAIYAIGGADITPANGTAAVFIGDSATAMRQLTAAVAAT